MNEGGRSGTVGPERNRIFGVLVSTEIALAVVLVIGAGLLVRSYALLTSADSGFNPDRMLMLLVNIPGSVLISGVTFDEAGAVNG